MTNVKRNYSEPNHFYHCKHLGTGGKLHLGSSTILGKWNTTISSWTGFKMLARRNQQVRNDNVVSTYNWLGCITNEHCIWNLKKSKLNQKCSELKVSDCCYGSSNICKGNWNQLETPRIVQWFSSPAVKRPYYWRAYGC